MSIHVPLGFQMGAVHCGLKRNPNKADLTLITCDRPATAAGVYTRNLVCAAPVVVDRERTPSASIRAVVTNSGCANACTGEQGEINARQMAALAAEACGAKAEEALVMSTGIIGEQLKMDKVETGIAAAASSLANDDEAFIAAAKGIMTTDLVHKVSGRELTLGGHTVRVSGMAKGSGMIGPNMATMLGVVLTDAPLKPEDAQAILADVADRTFNCISVDGHMSTNDTMLLLASGVVGSKPLVGDDLRQMHQAVYEVCEDLARAIADDGEGATHLVTIDVVGCASVGDARQIAATIANSPLVKTAIAGADPNWGRIVSAAGYARVPFRPSGVSLRLNGFLLYEEGTPVSFDAGAVSRSIKDHRETKIELQLSEGSASARFWTCDFTKGYIEINADYHT